IASTVEYHARWTARRFAVAKENASSVRATASRMLGRPGPVTYLRTMAPICARCLFSGIENSAWRLVDVPSCIQWRSHISAPDPLGWGWTAKLEYNFIKFETKDLNFAGTLQATGNGSLGYTWRQSVSADMQIVKVGVNYLFNF